ncbi:MAG: prolyl oligopeptidase family serine peptidase, partial [Acidobacteriota bacterium]
KEGAYFLKMYSSLRPSMQAHVAREARALGLPLAAHGMSIGEIVRCATWGCSVVEHSLSHGRIHEDLIRLLVATGMQWDPTLVMHGGYMAIRGMLLAPDVYHVGVAGAPVTDLAAHWAYESRMGPIEKNKEAYTHASNLRLADHLKGKLLLTHGTSDVNVPFSHTVKMIEALIQAGKSYDLLVLPGQGHDFTKQSVADYELEAIRRYFQEHLKP